MKGIKTIIIIIFFCFCFVGCSVKFTDLPISRKKPTKYYYTNLTAQSVVKGSNTKISVIEMNLLKEKPLAKENSTNLISFFKSLKAPNFITEPKDLPSKPEFKIFITEKSGRYVINVYNEKYASIYPWDGTYPMDYIDMTNINTLYNLYGFCKYLFK